MNRPPALLAPPTAMIPARAEGNVHRPSTSTHSVVSTHGSRVVPHITSTSPASPQGATSCSPSTSMVPADTGAPSRSPMAAAPGLMAGNCSEVMPISSSNSGAQPCPSDIGVMAIAVDESMAATPHRAWLASACAGHRASAPSQPANQRAKPTASPSVASVPDPTPRPRASPYSRPTVTGVPTESTPHMDGTMAETVTAAIDRSAAPASIWSQALSTPSIHAP